jgi:hypothetical protein
MPNRRPLVVALLACLSVAASSVALGSSGPLDEPREGMWLAGDFHIHTTYSHDSYGGPSDDNTGLDEAYTFGWSVGEQADLARGRGLDFIAITDHNDVRSVTDPAFDSPGLIWIPGYENSLAGHAQFLGTDHLIPGDPKTVGGMEELNAQLQDTGGVFQINHPSDMRWAAQFGHAFVPDTVEVWNIGPWLYQRPFPASNDNEFSLNFYDEFLDAEETVGVTGGSDNHWRSVTAMAGVGQPTTWVYASEPTAAAILEGLRAGRTTISNQPPALMGVFAYLEADADDDGVFGSMLGDLVPPGSRIRATVQGADGGYLRLVTNDSETLAVEEIDSADFSFEITMPEESTWVRAEVYDDDAGEVRSGMTVACDVIDIPGEEFGDGATTYCTNRLLVLALTSPIYFGYPDPEPTASPTPGV